MKSKFLILPWPLKCSSSLWICFSKATETEGIMTMTIKGAARWKSVEVGLPAQGLFSFCLCSPGEISSWNQGSWTSHDVNLCHSSFHSLRPPPKDSSLYLFQLFAWALILLFLIPAPTQWSVIPSAPHRLQQQLLFLFPQHLMAYHAFYCTPSPYFQFLEVGTNVFI